MKRSWWNPKNIHQLTLGQRNTVFGNFVIFHAPHQPGRLRYGVGSPDTFNYVADEHPAVRVGKKFSFLLYLL